MKGRITKEQRRRVLEMLDEGADRLSIASTLGISVAQVAAISAHRTMGTYTSVPPSLSPKPRKELPFPLSWRRNSPEIKPAHGHVVPLGVEADERQIVTWDLHASTNPHVLILGESGFGKTYAVTRLITELAGIHLPSIVFDYGQGFSAQQTSSLFRKSVKIVELQLCRDGIGLNPLQIFPVDTHGPATVAQRVADTFVRVYPRLGVQQHAVLRRAVLELLRDAGVNAEDPRTWGLQPPPFRDLEEKLNEYTATGDLATRRAAASAGPHISTLFFFNTFRKTGHPLSWSDLLTDMVQVWILQLIGLEASVERAVTEFLLWSLVRYFEVLGPGPLRCFVVLDEAHKLAFGPGSPVEKILREGRKFGLGMILASQQPEDFSTVAFSNTATKIVFQVGDRSGQIARQLHKKVTNGHSFEYIARAISTLPRGSAYVVTSNTGKVTRMFSFEERQPLGGTDTS